MDTTNYKEFHLYDIFDIDMGSKMDRGKMSDGDIAFVGRTANNNGINARVGLVVDHDKYGTVNPYPAGCLTLALGGSIGSCFYQIEPFYTSQNVAVLIPRNNVSEEIMMFVASVITHCVINGKYEAFSEELNKHIRTDFTIKLPATLSGEPDWNYMESYMRSVMEDCELKYQTLVKIANEKHKIDTTEWGEFKVEELFNIYTGKDIVLSLLDDGTIPIISHSLMNNGVARYVSKLDGVPLFDHKITISLADRGNFGAQVQSQDFYIGVRVKALQLKSQYVCFSTELALLFISAVINTYQSKFNYGDNCTDRVGELLLKLPVTVYGELDWSYMESYMQGVLDKQEYIVSCLKQMNKKGCN